jgi:2-phospho-L-lactate guanylyltransferase (CobY/MobA/RfbA family)
VAGLARPAEWRYEGGMTAYSALVLAGSRPGAADPVAAAEGVSHKALVSVGGAPMLARVIAALRGAGIARVAVSTTDPAVSALAAELGCIVLPALGGPSESVGAAFGILGAPLSVTTADHALLRPEWVRAFIDRTPPDTDVTILLARRDAIEAALPGTRRTYLRFADGHWSGCNLFLLASERAGAAIDTWRAVEADRKRPWRIAARLGPGMLLGYLTGRLTLSGAISRLGERIGIAARMVEAPDGLAAIDVDKASDLAEVRTIVGNHAGD